MLFNNDDFLRWCFIYNNNIVRFDKTQVNFNKFYEFIKTHYNSNFFIESINKMELHYKKIRGPYSVNPKRFILTTSRMTICEN